jgi:ribosomal protein S27AE
MADEPCEDEFPDPSDWDDDESDVEDSQLRCPACGRWVYEEAQQCPHCGEWIIPVHESSPWRRGVWLIAVVLLVAALVLMTIW